MHCSELSIQENQREKPPKITPADGQQPPLTYIVPERADSGDGNPAPDSPPAGSEGIAVALRGNIFGCRHSAWSFARPKRSAQKINHDDKPVNERAICEEG